MKEEKSNSHYIEDLEEWQDNQYNPAHYSGGKIPGNLQYPGRAKMVGIFLIVVGLMTLIPIILIAIESVYSDRTLLPIEFVLQFVKLFAAGGFSLVLVVSGIIKIINGTKHHSS